MTYLFSKKKDDQLIDLVRANPILYDPYHDHFRNNIMKHQVWENISRTLDIPLRDVKKRWRHFRDHYVKKLKMVEGSRRTRGKPWEHMKRLQFLALNRSRRELAEPAAMDDDRVVYLDPPQAPCSSGDEEVALKRRRRSSSEGAAPSADPVEPPAVDADDAPRPDPRVSEPARDAIYKFFESMAAIVAQFPARRAAEARLRVCQLITEMEIDAHADHIDDLDTPAVKLEQ